MIDFVGESNCRSIIFGPNDIYSLVNQHINIHWLALGACCHRCKFYEYTMRTIDHTISIITQNLVEN